MPAKVYYDDDANLALLKNKTIAILGYGSQGHAQAQNLRDSGCNVIIGQRKGSPNYDLAVSHGFKPMPLAEATETADIVNILLPDEVQGDLFRSDDQAEPGQRQPASLFARFQHALRAGGSAGRGRRGPRRPEGAGAPRAQRVREGGRRAVA